MSKKKENYAINILKIRLRSHQDILSDKDWASGNDESDKQSRKRLRIEANEIKEAIRILRKFNQPAVIGTPFKCKSCGNCGSFDINYNCFKCGKPFNGNDL